MNIKNASNENVVKGIGFIKSRKSDDKIMDMAALMHKMAKDIEIDLVDVIVDETADFDVDRKFVTELFQYIEKPEVVLVFVQSLLHISQDADDLIKFAAMAELNGIVLIDIEDQVIFIPEVVCNCEHRKSSK